MTMSVIRTVDLTINIDPKYLTSDLKERCLSLLKKTPPFTCRADIGYILEFKEVIDIKSSHVKRGYPSVILTLEALVSVLSPSEGDHLEGTVCMVLRQGVFVDVCNRLKILVPASNIQQRYSPITKSFGEYIVGMDVTVTIDKVKFTDSSFTCIGKFKVLDAVTKDE